MAAIAKKPKQTNIIENSHFNVGVVPKNTDISLSPNEQPNIFQPQDKNKAGLTPKITTVSLQPSPNQLRTNLGDSLVIPTTATPSITALNSPDYANMRVAAQNANTAKLGKTAANLTGIPAVIDTYSDAIDKNASIANNAGAIVAATPAALGNQASQAVDTRQKLVNQVVAPIAKPISEVADDFGKGLAGVRTANVDATAPPQQKTAIATKPVEPVTNTPPQVGTQNINPVENAVNQPVVKRGLAVGEFMPEVSKPEGNISPIGKAPDTEVYTTSPIVEGQPQASVSFKSGTPAIAKNASGVDSTMTIDNGRGGTGAVSGNSAGMARLGKPEAQSRLAGELARNADPAFQARMAEQVKIVDDRIAKRLANEAVIKKEAEQQQQAAQRNALIAQTKQSGNVGDKAVRESAMAQLQALDANARAEQDNQYKMATLGQNASQFEQQQQAAMAAAKNAATKNERDYQLKQQESDKPMDFYTPQFEKDGVTPIVDEVTGVQKQVRETMRPSEREARQKAANAQKLTSTLSDLKKVVDDPAASKEDKEAAALFIAKYGKGQ